jgi:hypothetical protein
MLTVRLSAEGIDMQQVALRIIQVEIQSLRLQVAMGMIEVGVYRFV